ncbi:MAG: DHH family phosphoesterase [Betaproteobacteria bacterium]|nr:DHH family phosphoesterase [Betaproteobacteria bacterium]
MSTYYDIFNGDADGLCALHQLRLATPRHAQLITGVKRDIQLLDRVQAQAARAGDEITVLDISMKSNAAALAALLGRGVKCQYFDHHASGVVPRHANLTAHIDTAPDICTSLIVDRHLEGRQRPWAVVAAFGDNLVASAIRAAQPLDLDHTELARLHELGDCLNYNAYGDTVDDLHYHPADLYRTIEPYRDPREFMIDEPVFDVLKNACREDLYRAEETKPEFAVDTAALYVLPDAAWARRVNGVFGNRLAQENPQCAHAVLVSKADGYVVSVRAPLANPSGADALCARFETGGGRKSAAGINRLPQARLAAFVDAFREAYAR